MEQEAFVRVEKKYLLTEDQAAVITDGLRRRSFYMLPFPDPAVQSLYYDTQDFLLIRRSLEKPNYKEKLRLRAYAAPTMEDRSYPEIKKKYRGVVYKRRIELPLREALSALKEERMPAGCGQIGREIEYFLKRYPDLAPRCLIMYDRDAWTSDTDQKVRITFDRRVRCRFDRLDVTLPQTGHMILNETDVLMEVKTPGVYPLWLVRLLEKAGARRIRFSKYGVAYRQHVFPGKKHTEEEKHLASIVV